MAPTGGMPPVTGGSGAPTASRARVQPKLLDAGVEQLAELEVELLAELVQHALLELRVPAPRLPAAAHSQRELDVLPLQVGVEGLELDQLPEVLICGREVVGL